MPLILVNLIKIARYPRCGNRPKFNHSTRPRASDHDFYNDVHWVLILMICKAKSSYSFLEMAREEKSPWKRG